MFFSLGDPTSAFQDVRLRRAVSMAIDRDALAKAIYNNDAQRQYYVYLWLGKWAMGQNDLPAETAQYYKYDPANAKRLLTQSGFADRQFKLVFVSGYLGAQYEQASQTVASMLSSAGFKVAPVEVDYQKDYIGGGKGIRYGNYDKDMIDPANPSGTIPWMSSFSTTTIPNLPGEFSPQGQCPGHHDLQGPHTSRRERAGEGIHRYPEISCRQGVHSGGIADTIRLHNDESACRELST